MRQRMLNHVKIQYYQKWKKLTFPANSESGVNVNNKDRIMSLLSSIITSTENFNRCVENDRYLSLILNQKLNDIFGGQQQILATDLLYYVDDNGCTGVNDTGDDGMTSRNMKVYHDESGE